MALLGVPSDQLPAVISTGETAVRFVFVSLSAGHPEGRDAEYIAWHSLDHRPEQYRLPELRNALRLVSTPACRAARAIASGPYDAADHVMTYMFTDEGGLAGFNLLGKALGEAGRMPIRLPSVGYMTSEVAGKVAAPAAVAGADVIPWRPALGVYVIIERGHASPASLVDVAGVAGVWWFHGLDAPAPYSSDARGLQITYCFLDADPVETAEALREVMARRWSDEDVEPLLAAPFFVIVPFEWDRYLPGPLGV